jgi:plasmid stabilization system protein ParE
MTYQLICSREAEDDFVRLYDHVMAQELRSPTSDLGVAARAIESIKQACPLLAHSPFSCRKTGDSTFVRELIVLFGSSGYVAMFEIRNSRQVIVGAVRHHDESDYH